MTDTIPTGWSNLSLAEIGTITGSSVDKKSKDNESVVRLLNYMDIYKNSLLDDSIKYQKVTASDSQLEKAKVNYGDVLFTPSSETPLDIGHSAVYLGLGENIVHSYHTVKLGAFTHILNDRYKAYVFNSENCLRFFRERASGSTRYTLNLKDFEELHVSIPPLVEQERIAEILVSVDDVIENTQTQINKLSDLKTATMNELLTKGIGHTEFRDSELGLIPKSWRVFSTSNLLNFKNGLNTGKESFGEGVPFLRFLDVMNGIKLTEQSFTVAVRVTEKQRKSFSVMYGDTFFARTSETPDEIGMANTYLGESISAVFNGFCIRGRPKNNDLLPDFSRYLFIAQYVREQMQKLCKFTTRAGITSESLGSCLVAIPDKREQKKIAETLSALDNQIEVKEQQLVQLESLKKSLMQDLLTGKVRVTAA